MKMKMRCPLRLKMLIVVILSLAVSIACFFAGMKALDAYISDVYMSETNTDKRAAAQIQSFASYVTSHSIKSTDSKALQAWQEQHSNVYILIYNNNDIVFDSAWTIEQTGSYKYTITNYETGEIVVLIQDAYGNTRELRRIGSSKNSRKQSSESASNSAGSVTSSEGDAEDESEADGVTTTEASGSIYYSGSSQFKGTSSIFKTDSATFEYSFYPVLFRDGLFDVCIVDYSDDTLQNVGYIALFVLSCVVFITIIIVYFGREVSRIRRLTEEVIKVSNDDMTGTITTKGSDEICLLASNVDSMRNTLIDQLSREKEAWQANSDLVTAMAHDIRTPLTVMAGYLELMAGKEYTSEEELDEYIRISSEKAEQLRMLSDKMFRYFYVYSKGEETLNMETFDAGDFLNQMLGEYVLLMEDNGFIFNRENTAEDAKISVDVQGMKRIIDNIFTNIRKYSDRTKPVDVHIVREDAEVKLYFRNYISAERDKAESTRIGILTCEKMAEEMGGSFTSSESGDVYEAVLTLPDVSEKTESEITAAEVPSDEAPNSPDGGVFGRKNKRKK